MEMEIEVVDDALFNALDMAVREAEEKTRTVTPPLQNSNRISTQQQPVQIPQPRPPPRPPTDAFLPIQIDLRLIDREHFASGTVVNQPVLEAFQSTPGVFFGTTLPCIL